MYRGGPREGRVSTKIENYGGAVEMVRRFFTNFLRIDSIARITRSGSDEYIALDVVLVEEQASLF